MPDAFQLLLSRLLPRPYMGRAPCVRGQVHVGEEFLSVVLILLKVAETECLQSRTLLSTAVESIASTLWTTVKQYGMKHRDKIYQSKKFT